MGCLGAPSTTTCASACSRRRRRPVRSRALYTEEHLALLREIEALRAEGLRPAAIRTRLAGRIKAAEQNEVDLVARRDQQTRDAILDAAARSFARKGYAGTRMADLIAELGITPQLLYQHFATKRELFVACYKVAVQYMNGFLRDRWDEARDGPERLVWYMYADEGIKAFAPGMFAAGPGGGAARRAGAGGPPRGLPDHLRRARRRARQAARSLRTEPPFPDELISHGIMGAFEQMLARASPGRRVLMAGGRARRRSGMYLAVLALYRGDLDVEASCSSPTRASSTRSPSCRRPFPPELSR